MTPVTDDELPCLKLAWFNYVVTFDAEDTVWRRIPSADVSPEWIELRREFEKHDAVLKQVLTNHFGIPVCLNTRYYNRKVDVFRLRDEDEEFKEALLTLDMDTPL